MKALKISLVILLIIIVSSFFYSWFVNHTINRLTQQVEHIQELVISDDWNTAKNGMEQVYAQIQKDEKHLGMLIDHAEMDNIVLSSARLKEFTEFEDDVNFHAESENLKALLEQIKEKEKLTIKNFF